MSISIVMIDGEKVWLDSPSRIGLFPLHIFEGRDPWHPMDNIQSSASSAKRFWHSVQAPLLWTSNPFRACCILEPDLIFGVAPGAWKTHQKIRVSSVEGRRPEARELFYQIRIRSCQSKVWVTLRSLHTIHECIDVHGWVARDSWDNSLTGSK